MPTLCFSPGPRLEGQARRAFAVSRLFDLGEAKVACASELEVNRAFAPELYRRVVPITRNSGGRFALDGDGETIEWAVEMLRFDESQTLDRIAETGGIDDALAQKLAKTVVAMHTRMPVIEANSWIAALEGFLEQNAAAFREHPLFSRLISRKSSIGRLVPSSNVCALCSPAEVGGASSVEAMAIFTSATLPCWKGVRCRSMRSNSTRTSPQAMSYTIWRFLLMDLLERGTQSRCKYRLQWLFRTTAIGRRPGWSCGVAVLHVAARGDTRQGDCCASAICRAEGQARPHGSCENLFPACRGIAFAAAAHVDRHWRIVGNRQVVACPRTGAACRARSGSSVASV